MARTHNPFAPKERSKVETPWGVFEIAPPNKARLAEIDALREEAMKLDADDNSQSLEASVLIGIRTAAAGLEDGEKLREALEAGWNSGEVTVEQIRSLAEFVGAEISGEVNEGNG
jgi:hypothetical protein